MGSRRLSWYAFLALGALVSACASFGTLLPSVTPPSPTRADLNSALLSLNTAENLLTVDFVRAIEHFSEAKVICERIQSMAQVDPTTQKEASGCGAKAIQGVAYVQTASAFRQNDAEALCGRAPFPRGLARQQLGEYRSYMSVLDRAASANYLVRESALLSERIKSAASRLEECIVRAGRPTAKAGPSQTVQAGSRVVLDGGGSSGPEGAQLSYQWSQVDGPARVPLNSQNAQAAWFIPSDAGQYRFRLVVVSDGIESTPDVVTVTVTRTVVPPRADAPRPSADAGADQTIVVGARVLLDGGGSRDPQGEALDFAWEQVSGPVDVQLSGQATSRAAFVATQPGTYRFRLVVSSRSRTSAPGTVTITVMPAAVPAPPAPTPIAPGRPSSPPPSKCTDLGAFSRDGTTGTLRIVVGALGEGKSACYQLRTTSFGDLQVLVPVGYRVTGGGFSFKGLWRFERDLCIYNRYIREKVPEETAVGPIAILREAHSPEKCSFQFNLYPR